MVRRNNPGAKWVYLTKDANGVYWSGNRVGRRWKIWNKSGYADYTGAIEQCAYNGNVFKAVKQDLNILIDKAESSGTFDKCGSSVATDCEGVTIEMTEEGWQLATNQLTDAAAFLITATAQAMAADMTFTMKRALNSLKCAVTGFGNNFWQLLAAVYYAALQFGYERQIVKYVAEYYPYVCTCQKETEALSQLFGGDDSTASVMGGCSEKVQAEFADQKEI